MKFICERCGDPHDNNDTPKGESFCDDHLTMDDVFPSDEDEEE